MNTALSKVEDSLRKRGIEYEYHAPSQNVAAYIICEGSAGVDTYIFSSGRNCVYMSGVMSPEVAVMSVAGNDALYENTWMDFGGIRLNLPTDGESVLMSVEKAKLLEDRMRRLQSKDESQRKNLRKLLAKQIKQAEEIARMEENALTLAVLSAGYSDGE